MQLFLTLFLAHLISDFPLQFPAMIAQKLEKKEKSIFLYLHILIHGVMTLGLLRLAGQPIIWVGVVIILVSHWAIDLGKVYAQNDKNKRLLFFVDQGLHLLVLVGVVGYYGQFEQKLLEILDVQRLLLFLTAIILLTSVSSVIIKNLISKWSPPTTDEKDESLAKAGSFIGVLERLFVFGFIVSGQWSGVGFLLAAKSIFRFGDLKDPQSRKMAEYFLIGTLLSFGLALLVALLYLRLKQG